MNLRIRKGNVHARQGDKDGLAREADRLGEQTLREMLLTSERLFAETGHYYGQKTLPIRTEKPILYEKVFSHLRGGLERPVDGA